MGELGFERRNARIKKPPRLALSGELPHALGITHEPGGTMRTTYRPEYQPSAREVRDAFADEMRSLGGAVVDELEDADNFIGRAVLQSDAEIRPGDVVKGGVAIRVTGAEILVHPYTFRLVCTNGAVVAHALGSRRIERIERTEV